MCQDGGRQRSPAAGAIHGDITTIGLDLAKSVFQVQPVDKEGGIVLPKRLRRGQVLAFFAGIPRSQRDSTLLGPRAEAASLRL
jgi:hypothetical protein